MPAEILEGQSRTLLQKGRPVEGEPRLQLVSFLTMQNGLGSLKIGNFVHVATIPNGAAALALGRIDC
jgi:hypothetical protein